ncbi:serine protease [Nonomuraea sp. NPDC050310]|uniref:S1 family peptidase n=1 Tax=Nonomuraea sp. NPDC050310 TaxID=3154935 RepID=UPI0033DE6EA2
MVAAKAEPAVRQVTWAYKATLVVPAPVVQPRALNKLVKQADAHAAAGRIPKDRQSRLKWVLQEVAQNVNRYLKPGNQPRLRQALTHETCTGWWLTPQGHLVTAARCAAGKSEAAVKPAFSGKDLAPFVRADTKEMLAAFAKHAQVDDGMAKLAEEVFTLFHTRHLQVKRRAEASYLGTFEEFLKGDAARLSLVARGQEWPGRDVAVLKLKGARNLPTLPLGLDGDVRTGDLLFASSHPRPLSDSALLDAASRRRPLLTEGGYTSRRVSTAGVPYLVTQIPAYRGSEGAPVLDERGRVVGLVATVVQDARIGARSEITTLALPVGLVREHLAAAAVRPVTAETTRVYERALADFYAGRYRAALPKFRKVLALHPAHPYVRDYIQQATAKSKRGSDA